MGIKSSLSKPYAKYIAKKVKKESANAISLQEKVFISLIEKAKNTVFGKDHHYKNLRRF